MTFRLPEIEISDRIYAIAKIILLVSFFSIVAFGVLSAADAVTNEEKYKFVYCKNPITNITMTYPEGTSCDISDTNEEDDENDE
jgi:hypothetical protein